MLGPYNRDPTIQGTIFGSPLVYENPLVGLDKLYNAKSAHPSLRRHE